jgi:hypothetical protein
VSALVGAEQEPATGWAWTKPFTLSLWLAIIATMVVWPACIFVLEAYALRGRIKLRHIVVGLEESVWRSLWALFFGETIQLATLGAKVAAATFAFMSLILSSAYTGESQLLYTHTAPSSPPPRPALPTAANLAAFLTLGNAGTVSSVEELVGSAVASVPVFIDRLKSDYGIIASDANITDTASILRTADLVNQGKLKAFVYNTVILQWTAASYPGCKLHVVDEVVPFYYAVPFAKDVDPGLVAAFSDSVFKLLETGLMAGLESKYINTNSMCFDANTAVSVELAVITAYVNYL